MCNELLCAHVERCEVQSSSAAGESESEDDDDEDSDFDEQPLVKRRKSASKKPAGQPGPKRQTPKGKKVMQTHSCCSENSCQCRGYEHAEGMSIPL